MISDVNSPVDYQSIESINNGGVSGSAFNFAQVLSPKDHLVGNIRWNGEQRHGIGQNSYSFLQG